jgi:hypothetical protein
MFFDTFEQNKTEFTVEIFRNFNEKSFYLKVNIEVFFSV